MLLLSIHDVSPAHEAQVQQLWAMCTARGVSPALLVVPNWHGKRSLARSPAFVAWLHQCVKDGADIILHGYRHDELGMRRSIRDQWRAFGRTEREGEFLTLQHAAARERIADGLRVLRALDLNPMGFIPPAWLAREACHAAVAELGLAMSEDARAVRLHARGVRMPAPVVCWSGRTPLRAWASAALAEARWAVYQHAPLVRLSLHPADLDHPATTRSISTALDRWLTAHRWVRYKALATARVSRMDARSHTSR